MKDINYDTLCNLIALEVGNSASENSVKKYLRATYKVILKQLKLNHRIAFKGFGYWEIKQRKSGERIINDLNNGGKRLVYVEPRYSIFFKAFENFEVSVNENDFKIASDKGVKRLTKKRPTVTSTDLINIANSRASEKGE